MRPANAVSAAPANVVEDYGWAAAAGPKSCGYIAPRILGLLAQIGARRVLDLGCGNGTLCGQLAARGYDVAGIDFDRRGVEVARRSHPGVRFYRFGLQDDPKRLMAHEQPFDVVVSTEVVEHLFSPHLLPIYAWHCLTAGGHLIVSTPYHGYLKNLALSVFDRWDAHHTALWHGGHIKFWSRSTLTRLLAGNGFHVVSISGSGRLPFLWKSMILVARRM